MPRIPDNITACAVYIYPSKDAANKGEDFGGSGFLAAVPFLNGYFVYVITNAHVVQAMNTPAIRVNGKSGNIEIIETVTRQWHMHPSGDDIAAYPLPMPQSFDVLPIPTNLFVTPDLMYDEDIGIGDDIFMVGRFVGYDGVQKNTPATRFGAIAMTSGEPIRLKSGKPQECFLIETRSLPGYSGSPVFIYSPTAAMDGSLRRFGREKTEPPDLFKANEGELRQFFDSMKSKGPYLLGLDFMHLQDRVPVLNQSEKPEGKLYVEQNSGMAAAVPAWKIKELLDIPAFDLPRQEFEQELKKGLAFAAFDSTQNKGESS